MTTDHRRWVAAVAVSICAICVIVGVAEVAGDQFGDSHDGRNGAVWASASRALRSDGVLESRLGAVRADGVYANHPPLIIVETALAETVFGARRWVTRLPAYLGSTVALVVLYRVARRLGLGRSASGVGVALGASSAMFTGFAAMLDTPVTSLPFALLLVERRLAWRDPTATRQIAVLGCLALAATLAGWQSALAAGLVGVAAAVRRDRRTAIALGGGVALGVALILVWQLWVFGSLDNVVDNFRSRAGLENDGPTTTRLGALGKQTRWLLELSNPVALVVALGGLGLLLHDGGRRRAVAASSVLVVLLYDALLPGGAHFHNYWSFWAVAPLSLGSSRFAEELFARSARVSRVTAVGVSALVAVAPGVALVDNPILDRQRRGLDAVRLAVNSDVRPTGSLGLTDPSAWVRYETGDDRLHFLVDEWCRSGPGCTTIANLHIGADALAHGTQTERRGDYVLLEG